MAFSVGENSQWRWFLLSSFNWKLNKDVDLTLHADERTKRGFGTGADLKYRMDAGGEGLLTGDYLDHANPNDGTNKNSGKNSKDDNDTDIHHLRYRGEWQHKSI